MGQKRRQNHSMLLSSSWYNFYTVKIINTFDTNLTKDCNTKKFGGVEVKSCEGSEILPYSQGNKLVSQFQECWQKTWDFFESATKDDLLLTAIVVIRESIFLPWFPRPPFPWPSKEVQVKIADTVSYTRGEEPQLREAEFFTTGSKPTISLSSQAVSKQPFALAEDATSSKTTQTSLKKQSATKRVSASACKMARNAWDPGRIVTQKGRE